MRLVILMALLFPFLSNAQSIFGTWKNIDDEDGEAKSHIEIYEQDGLIHGKVIKLLDNATLRTCTKCKDERKDQEIEGMVILWNLKPEKKKNKYNKGKIIDPKNGKIYGCKMELKEEDLLHVRGYIKSPLFGRTQKWYRVKDTSSTQ